MHNDLEEVNIKKLNVETEFGNKLVDAITRVMEGDDYEVGCLEAAQYTADKTGKVLAKLMVVLLNKGIIEEQELKDICKHIF